MAHLHSVYDTDSHFSIDKITRAIKNESSKKVTVMQFDHNSERFTFDLPRYIEGHDMSVCNLSEVHYQNGSTKDVYVIDDLQISPADNDVVICSWLISRNATQNAAALDFRLTFSCVSEEGKNEYEWNTGIHKGISVQGGIRNSEIIVEEYADVLEQWRKELFSASAEGVTNITQAKEAALNDIAEAGKTIVEEANNAASDAQEVVDTVIPDVNQLKVDLANGKTKDGAIKVQKLEGITFIESVNLVSAETTNQGINSDNTISDSLYYQLHKEYIPISAGETIYRLNTNAGALIGLYDENKNPLVGVGRIALTTEKSWTFTRDEIKYIRIADHKNSVLNQVWSKVEVSEYIPYGDKYDFSGNPMFNALTDGTYNKKYPKLTNKRWLFMGDSITEGVDIQINGSYFNKAIEMSGAIGTNKGIGGSLISNGQYSGQRLTSILSLSSYDETSEYYIDFSQYDILTIFSGTNDWGFNNENVCAALNTALQNIQERNPDLRICVFTPMYRSRKSAGDGMNSDEHSYHAVSNTFDGENGYYLYDLSDLIEQTCRKNHIPCKNLYRTFQINKYNADTLLYDGVHPNAKGVAYLANIICQFVSDNIGY